MRLKLIVNKRRNRYRFYRTQCFATSGPEILLQLIAFFIDIILYIESIFQKLLRERKWFAIQKFKQVENHWINQTVNWWTCIDIDIECERSYLDMTNLFGFIILHHVKCKTLESEKLRSKNLVKLYSEVGLICHQSFSNGILQKPVFLMQIIKKDTNIFHKTS